MTTFIAGYAVPHRFCTIRLRSFAGFIFEIKKTCTSVHAEGISGDIREEFSSIMAHSFLHFIFDSRFQYFYCLVDGNLLDYIDRVIDPQKTVKHGARLVDFNHG